MLTYSLDERSTVPLYEQLYRLIRADILGGVLKTGERLPSRRAFSQHLGISSMTVSGAYAQLQSEGYIEAVSRSGYYVCAVPQRPARPADTATAVTAAPQLHAPAADFTTNRTLPERFPFSVWSHIMRGVLNSRQEELMISPPPGGIPALREAIAAHLRTFRGMQVDPQQIVIGAGAEYMYGLLVQLNGRGCRFAVEDPGYHKAARVLESFGAECVYSPMDSRGIVPALLERDGIQTVLVSPSHHYPTGIVMPAGRRMELLAWAAKAPGRYIVEDDYDSEFRLSGRPVPSLQSMDTQERVIYLNTFTKTLASTVRIAYLVLPRPLLARYRNGCSASTVSNFEQYTLAEFISGGSFEQHLNRMRRDYRRKRDQLLESIRESPLGSMVTVSGTEAGLHFLMRVDTPLPDEVLCRRCAEKGILLNPLSRFCHEPRAEAEHCFVMNYSSLGASEIPGAVALLAEAIGGAEQPRSADIL